MASLDLPSASWAQLQILKTDQSRVNDPLNNTALLPAVPKFIHWLENDFFNEQVVHDYFQKYWHYSIYLAGAYLISIYFFKRYMDTRAAFDLRKPLVVWSALLAVFSIFGAYRFLFGFYQLTITHGVKGTLCATYYYRSSPEGFWVAAFVLSKIPELFDTFFIIARKKKLIFLHWYHHATVMVYSFYLYKDRLAGGAYYGTMNFTVHAIMYTYYALAAARIKVPRQVNMVVTTLQTMQMFIGVFVTIYLSFNLNNPQCPIHWRNVTGAMLMYSTYLYLFAEFFFNTYIRKRASILSKAAKKSN